MRAPARAADVPGNSSTHVISSGNPATRGCSLATAIAPRASAPLTNSTPSSFSPRSAKKIEPGSAFRLSYAIERISGFAGPLTSPISAPAIKSRSFMRADFSLSLPASQGKPGFGPTISVNFDSPSPTRAQTRPPCQTSRLRGSRAQPAFRPPGTVPMQRHRQLATESARAGSNPR